MENAPEAPPRQPFPWSCGCDECYAGRQARPPTQADLVKYADLIAARQKVGARPEPKNNRATLPNLAQRW